jgi:hypothetical protein
LVAKGKDKKEQKTAQTRFWKKKISFSTFVNFLGNMSYTPTLGSKRVYTISSMWGPESSNNIWDQHIINCCHQFWIYNVEARKCPLHIPIIIPLISPEFNYSLIIQFENYSSFQCLLNTNYIGYHYIDSMPYWWGNSKIIWKTIFKINMMYLYNNFLPISISLIPYPSYLFKKQCSILAIQRSRP